MNKVFTQNKILLIEMIIKIMNLNVKINDVVSIEYDDEIDENFCLSFIDRKTNDQYQLNLYECDDIAVNKINTTSSNNFEVFYERMKNKTFRICMTVLNFDQEFEENYKYEEFVFNDSFFQNHELNKELTNLLQTKKIRMQSIK